MKTVVMVVIGLIILGVGIFFAKDYLPKLTSKQGEIRVESQPEVTVFINGETKTKTPFTQKVDPGQYEIKLLPEDQTTVSTWQQTITVNPGTQTYIRTQLGDSTITTSWEIITLEKLEKKETELSVSSDSDGAELYFDGEFKGNAPLSFKDITAGEHEVRLTAPGFAEKKIKVDVTEGYKLSVRTQLALVDEAQIKKLEEESQTGKPVSESQSTVRIKSPSTGWLRVRSEPSREGEEVARVDDGKEYPLVSEQDEWYEIEYEEGKTGWISGSYAEKVEESQGDQDNAKNDEEEQKNE